MHTKFILTFLLFFMISGCITQQEVVNKYYTLEHVLTNQEENGDQSPLIQGFCEITPVEINSMYESNKIVNRTESHEISFYKNHQWAARPSISIREMVLRHLETSVLFEGISTRYMNKIPDYRFSTILRKLEVIEDKDEFSAHLDIEFRLLNISGRQLMNHSVDRTVVLADRDLNLFAEIVSDMIHEELDQFIFHISEENFSAEKTNDPDPGE